MKRRRHFQPSHQQGSSPRKFYFNLPFLISLSIFQLVLLVILLSAHHPSLRIISDLDDQINMMRAQSSIRSGLIADHTRKLENLKKNIAILPNASDGVRNFSEITGVAVMFMNDSPKWFQRRYTSKIQNILSNIPESWPLQIFHYNSTQFYKGLNVNPGLKRMIAIEHPRLSFVAIPKRIKMGNKNMHMLFLPWIWDNIRSEMVLFIGGNHLLCSNSQYTLHSFLPSARRIHGSNGYDYISAPWQKYKGVGGGGGVSLRNVTAIRLVLKQAIDKDGASNGKPHFKWGRDDEFFVNLMIQANKDLKASFKLASRGDTQRFSSAYNFAWTDSFTVSGTLKEIDFLRRETILERSCVEMKMILPSLHEPKCFGRNLSEKDSKKCRESICCLNNTKKKSC